MFNYLYYLLFTEIMEREDTQQGTVFNLSLVNEFPNLRVNDESLQ